MEYGSVHAAEAAYADYGSSKQDLARDAMRAFDEVGKEEPKPRDAKPSVQPQGEWYFSSRAEAAAALLRRTEHNTGAKHFAAGGITVHVNDLALAAGTREQLPKELRMEVTVLGTTHSFDVGTSAKVADTMRLGQIVNFEVDPQSLPSQMAAMPTCEFRLFAGRAKDAGRNAVRVRVNGAPAPPAAANRHDDTLLARTEHDLASQQGDVVNVPLPLDRVAKSDKHDASEPLGSLYVSIVAERGTGSTQRRGEGGMGTASYSGYGAGYGAGSPERASHPPGFPAWRPGGTVPHHARSGPTLVDDSNLPAAAAYRALPPRPATAQSVAQSVSSSRMGSRPPSRGGPPAPSRPGSVAGSRVRGAGSVISAGGHSAGTSASTRRAVTETPVGFQYKSIPTRYLTPRAEPQQAADDGRDGRSECGRSVCGRSACGSTAASHLTARSVAATSAATTSAGSINSHALAEGFWSAWRQKQLPPGRLKPGMVAVVVEVRYDQGGMTTRHDGSKYEMYAERVQNIVRDVLGSSGMCVVVPENRGGYSGADPFASWQTAHGARLGAFELQLCYHQAGVGIVSETLHSKLISKKWPASRRIELALKSFCRHIILRPLIETSDGMEPVLPDHLVVRLHTSAKETTELHTEVVTVGPMPSGPRTLAGLPSEVDDPGGEAEAREARQRIAEFMESHDVVFNGAGEADLPSVTQAWSVRHTKAARRRQNLDTLRGVAAILMQYPSLRCEVHGETGRAQSVPQKLAEHLNIQDPVRDVQRAMDMLAQLRAQACLEALVDEGVPESQLFVTYKGQGGQLCVEFVPKATKTGGESGGAASASRRGEPDAQALAFKLMRGTEDDCFVTVLDHPSSEYEPFELSLNDLMLGARDIGDGALDVPVVLVPTDEDMRRVREEERRRRQQEDSERNRRDFEEAERSRRESEEESYRRREAETAARQGRAEAARQGREAAEAKRRQQDIEDADRRGRQQQSAASASSYQPPARTSYSQAPARTSYSQAPARQGPSVVKEPPVMGRQGPAVAKAPPVLGAPPDLDPDDDLLTDLYAKTNKGPGVAREPPKMAPPRAKAPPPKKPVVEEEDDYENMYNIMDDDLDDMVF